MYYVVTLNFQPASLAALVYALFAHLTQPLSHSIMLAVLLSLSHNSRNLACAHSTLSQVCVKFIDIFVHWYALNACVDSLSSQQTSCLIYDNVHNVHTYIYICICMYVRINTSMHVHM